MRELRKARVLEPSIPMKLDLLKIPGCLSAVLLLLLLPGPGRAEQAVATVDLEWIAKAKTDLGWKGNLKLRPLTGEGAVRTVAVEGKAPVRLDLPAGSVWDLKVEAPGVWAPATTVEAGPAGSASVRRIELWPTAPVTGTVRMADPKQPLPKEIGATIESPPGPAHGREIARGSVSCLVDPKGVFRCELPAVRIDVAFRAGSFVPQYRWGLNLQPGQSFPVGSLELKQGASLKGWVEAEGGPIVAGKCIARLAPMISSGRGDVQLAERLRRSTAEAQVRPDGFFQLAGFVPGSYQLEVSQPGYAPAKVFPIDVWAGSETALKQAVVLKRPVQIDLSLVPPADWLGKPWKVRIFRGADTSTGSEPEPAFEGSSDVEGRIRIAGQTPGSFWVKVMDSTGSGLVYQELTVQGPEDGQQSIEIPFVTLQGSLSLGRHPLAARLFFGGRNAAVSIKMESDEKGRFHGVLPREGTWPVDIRSDDGTVETLAKVKIAADRLGRASAEIRLPDTHVFGSVVNEESRPVPGAEVALASGTDVIQAETDGEGRFEVRGAPEGPVQLLARHRSRDAHSASDVTFLALSDSQDVGPVQLRLRPMKTVTGRIQGGHGPVTGATVLVQPLQPPLGFSGAARTGLDGAFSVEVPAQAQVVQATVSPPGYALKAFQFEPDGIPVVLNVPEDGGTLEFSLPYSGEDAREIGLAYLVFQNGLPLAAPQLMPWAKGHGSPYAGATGADFQVPNLAPGDYRVCVVPRAGMTAWALSGWSGGIAECAAGSLSSGGTLRLKVSKSREG